MALQLSEFREEILGHFRNRGDITSARLNRIINLIQKRITRRYDWFEIHNVAYVTTSFTGDITIDKLVDTPPSLKVVKSLRLIDGTDSRKLIAKPYQIWDSFLPNPGQYRIDRPSFYTRWGLVFELWPVPNAVYTIECRHTKWLDDMVLDTDTAGLLEKDDLIIAGACNYVANAIGRMEDAVRHWRVYSNLLQAAIDVERTEPDLVQIPELNRTSRLGSGTSNQYWLDPMSKRAP